jgi:hypothetical protein
MDYILVDKYDNEYEITECLDNIWNEFKNAVVIVRQNGKQVFKAKGALVKQKLSGKIYDFFVNNRNFEDFLFNHVGETMEIEIDEIGKGDIES